MTLSLAKKVSIQVLLVTFGGFFSAVVLRFQLGNEMEYGIWNMEHGIRDMGYGTKRNETYTKPSRVGTLAFVHWRKMHGRADSGHSIHSIHRIAQHSRNTSKTPLARHAPHPSYRTATHSPVPIYPQHLAPPTVSCAYHHLSVHQGDTYIPRL